MYHFSSSVKRSLILSSGSQRNQSLGIDTLSVMVDIEQMEIAIYDIQFLNRFQPVSTSKICHAIVEVLAGEMGGICY
jgi:hypothetical protein